MFRENCIFFEEHENGREYRSPYCTHYQVPLDHCENYGKACRCFCDKETICNLLKQFFRKNRTP